MQDLTMKTTESNKARQTSMTESNPKSLVDEKSIPQDLNICKALRLYDTHIQKKRAQLITITPFPLTSR